MAISQRWEEDFQHLVKQTASEYGMSMTQLTIEALKCFIELGKFPDFKRMDELKRRNLIVSGMREMLQRETGKEQSIYDINTDGLDEIGLIRDQVSKLLENNPNRHFSTNEIAEILGIPQSTARTYARQISEETNRYILLPGRPNKIYYENSLTP